MRADLPRQCVLGPVWPGEGIYVRERRLREGEVRTIELYYKNRVLPARFLNAGFSHLRKGELPQALAPPIGPPN